MTAHLNRRHFLQVATGAAAGTVWGRPALLPPAALPSSSIQPIRWPARRRPARWAAEELVRALTNRSISARIYARSADAPPADLRVVATALASRGAAAALGGAGVRAEVAPEALVLCETREVVVGLRT